MKSKLTWFKEKDGEWARYYPYYFKVERKGWFYYRYAVYCRNIQFCYGIAITLGIAKRMAEKQQRKHIKQCSNLH